MAPTSLRPEKHIFMIYFLIWCNQFKSFNKTLSKYGTDALKYISSGPETQRYTNAILEDIHFHFSFITRAMFSSLHHHNISFLMYALVKVSVIVRQHRCRRCLTFIWSTKQIGAGYFDFTYRGVNIKSVISNISMQN